MSRQIRARRAGKNTVQNVRVMDEYAGSDAAYIDRCISTLQNSHSQVTVLVQLDQLFTSSTSASTFTNFSGNLIRSADDFVSLQAQFQEFRVRGIRFDVYDLTAAVSLAVVFSTFHSTAVTPPAYNFENVIDGPDSQLIPSGVGKVSLYWRAKGTEENDFQGDSTSDAAILDFGGLRGAIPQSATTKQFLVVMKCLVDFRARV